MSQIKINVVEEDITSGLRRSAQNCPIARAIQRELDRRDRSGIEVTTSYIKVDGKLYKLPKKSQQFVKRFDNKMSVKPFSFMLRENKTKGLVARPPSYMAMPSMNWSSLTDTTYSLIINNKEKRDD